MKLSYLLLTEGPKRKFWINYVFLKPQNLEYDAEIWFNFQIVLIFDLMEKREKIQKIINISVNFIPTEDLLIYLKSLWKSKSDGMFKSSNTEGKKFNYFDICRPKCHFFYKIKWKGVFTVLLMSKKRDLPTDWALI